MPWAVLREAGHEVVFATEKAGTVPAADPRLLTGVLFGQLGAAAGGQEAVLRAGPGAGVRRDGGLGRPGPGRLRRADPAGRARPRHAAVPRLAGAQRAGRPVLAAEPPGRRDLPRRAGAGAHPRPGHRPQRAGRPPHHLPAEVHGAFGLPGDRVAAGPLLPHLPGLRRGRGAGRAGRPGRPVRARAGHAVGARHRRPTTARPSSVHDRNYVSARWPGDAYLFARGFRDLLASAGSLYRTDRSIRLPSGSSPSRGGRGASGTRASPHPHLVWRFLPRAASSLPAYSGIDCHYMACHVILMASHANGGGNAQAFPRPRPSRPQRWVRSRSSRYSCSRVRLPN